MSFGIWLVARSRLFAAGSDHQDGRVAQARRRSSHDSALQGLSTMSSKSIPPTARKRFTMSPPAMSRTKSSKKGMNTGGVSIRCPSASITGYPNDARSRAACVSPRPIFFIVGSSSEQTRPQRAPPPAWRTAAAWIFTSSCSA